MSKTLDEEWKKALTEIIKLLDNEECRQLIEFFPGIPHRKRIRAEFKSELPDKIINCGVDKSIQRMKEALDEIWWRHNEVQNLLGPFVEKPEKTDEPRSPQPQQDIHAVLRELTASLVEQKLKMEYLEKENQEQAAKLKDVERQKAEIDQLKLQSKEQTAKLETEIEQLKQELKALSVQEKMTTRR